MNKNLANSIKAGVIGAGMGFYHEFLINYVLIPVPISGMSNPIGNGLSGLLSGFMGLFMYLRASESNE